MAIKQILRDLNWCNLTNKLEDLFKYIMEQAYDLDFGSFKKVTELNTTTEVIVQHDGQKGRANHSLFKGLKGEPGAKGKDGVDGKDFKYSDFTEEQLKDLEGSSAYQIWLDNGNTGTENDFLIWMQQGEFAQKTYYPVFEQGWENNEVFGNATFTRIGNVVYYFMFLNKTEEIISNGDIVLTIPEEVRPYRDRPIVGVGGANLLSLHLLCDTGQLVIDYVSEGSMVSNMVLASGSYLINKEEEVES